MARNWKISFAVLVLAILGSIVYAFVQKTVAQASQREADVQTELADHEKAVADTLASKYVATSLELEELKKKCP